jgi:pSer/pThr/pTyr-binding forkhead associated (FHA) protein
VEKSKNFFDENVIFQFSTEVIEDQQELEQSSLGVKRKGALGARVIEIQKRKSTTNPDMITIGRSPENDIVLYNRLVSKSHAYLGLGASDEAIFLVDNYSTNGTYVNNIELSATGNYQLAEGDEISFGPETKVVYFSPKLFHSLLSGLKSLH